MYNRSHCPVDTLYCTNHSFVSSSCLGSLSRFTVGHLQTSVLSGIRTCFRTSRSRSIHSFLFTHVHTQRHKHKRRFTHTYTTSTFFLTCFGVDVLCPTKQGLTCTSNHDFFVFRHPLPRCPLYVDISDLSDTRIVSPSV